MLISTGREPTGRPTHDGTSPRPAHLPSMSSTFCSSPCRAEKYSCFGWKRSFLGLWGEQSAGQLWLQARPRHTHNAGGGLGDLGDIHLPIPQGHGHQTHPAQAPRRRNNKNEQQHGRGAGACSLSGAPLTPGSRRNARPPGSLSPPLVSTSSGVLRGEGLRGVPRNGLH